MISFERSDENQQNSPSIPNRDQVKNISFQNYRIKPENMLHILKFIILSHFVYETFSTLNIYQTIFLILVFLTPRALHKLNQPKICEHMILCMDLSLIALILLSKGDDCVFTCLFFNLTLPCFFKPKLLSFKSTLIIGACQFAALTIFSYEGLIKTFSELMPRIIALKLMTVCVGMIFINILLNFLETPNSEAPVIEDQKSHKPEIGTEKQRTFILSFSHELRNLINNMLGNIQVSMNEEPNSKVKEYLKNAKICGEMLIYSINNILDTGKIDSGNLEINVNSLNIYSALLDIWGVCSALIKKKELSGQMYISKNLPQIIKSDPYRLAQIIFNLMSNAIKYTESGSVRLIVEWIGDSHKVSEKVFQPVPYDEEGLFEKKSKILAFSDDFFLAATETTRKNQFPYLKSPLSGQGILKLTIIDSGTGIDEGVLENCFFKLNSHQNSESQRQLKTGLGLFVTKQIVERLSGEIRGYSSKGRGSSLVVCLPTESLVEESNMLARRSFSNSICGDKINALVVDDDNFFHNVMANYLNKLEIEIEDSAFNGEEAVTKYKDMCKLGMQPSMITLDLEMPVMNGKEAAMRIRNFEREMKIKPCVIIISSANCDKAEINECLNENGKILAQEFLKKPVQLSELKRVVNKYFS